MRQMRLRGDFRSTVYTTDSLGIVRQANGAKTLHTGPARGGYAPSETLFMGGGGLHQPGPTATGSASFLMRLSMTAISGARVQSINPQQTQVPINQRTQDITERYPLDDMLTGHQPGDNNSAEQPGFHEVIRFANRLELESIASTVTVHELLAGYQLACDWARSQVVTRFVAMSLEQTEEYIRLAISRQTKGSK